MLLALISLLALSPVQDAAQDPAPDPPPPPVWRIGHLRHVQPLGLQGEVLRYATAMERATHVTTNKRIIGSVVAVYEGSPKRPVAELVLDTPRQRTNSWEERRTWHLLELEDASFLAYVDTEQDHLHLARFPSGEVLHTVEGGAELLDARVRADRGEVLTSVSGALVSLSVSAQGEVRQRELPTGFSRVSAARFVRGAEGSPRLAWVAGWRAEQLSLRALGPDGFEPPVALELEHEGLPKHSLRLAVHGQGLAARLALGFPNYKSSRGRLAIYDVEAAPKLLYQGRPDPEVDRSNTADQTYYAQDLEWITDASEDGLPDLLVTGPWSFVSKLDLLSGADGQRLLQWCPEPFNSSNHVDLLPGGGYAVLGGTDNRGYPEQLQNAGQLYLVRVPELTLVTTLRRTKEAE